MPIFMKYDGVDGEVTVQGFEKYIELNSFQFGVGRGIGAARGGSTREGSTPSISEIVCTKVFDKASMGIWEESLKGELDNKVKICFVRTGTGSPEAYVTYELEDCGVSGWSVSSGGDRPNESVSLNFTKVTITYNPVGDNLSGDPIPFGWDMATEQKV